MDELTPLSKKPDYLVCTCMGVMCSEIEESIAEGNDSFDALSECLEVGTGCNSCVEEVNYILKEVKE